MLVDDEDQIGEHVGQLHREKALFGLEIPKLQHEEGLNGSVGEGLHECGFGGAQGEVIGALVVGKVWPVVECSDLDGIKQVQTFGALGGGFGCWAQGSSPRSRARSRVAVVDTSGGVCKQTPLCLVSHQSLHSVPTLSAPSRETIPQNPSPKSRYQ